MSVEGSSGTRVYIGPVTAAATGSAYAALTWVEIGSVETVGDIGDSAASVTFTGLAAARVRKFKGPRDAGDVAVVCGADPLDTGQIAAIAAEAAKFAYAFKVVLEDSADANDTDSVIYFHAKVMSKNRSIGGASDVLKRTFNLAIDTAPIEVASVAA